MYKLICTISVVVRQFYLPNPFECFGNMAVLYNWIAEGVLHIVAYTLVGLVYRKRSNPALGSFLYLLTYVGLTGILWVLGQFAFAWWAVATMVVIIAAVLFVVYRLRGGYRW